jgi:hypothetical protein
MSCEPPPLLRDPAGLFALARGLLRAFVLPPFAIVRFAVALFAMW